MYSIFSQGTLSRIQKKVHFFIVNVISLWWMQQESACLSSAAKQRPKLTAKGETWQSCRQGKGRVLSRLLMIMAAGVQTDSAELVCTLTGHRFIHAPPQLQERVNRYDSQRPDPTSLDHSANSAAAHWLWTTCTNIWMLLNNFLKSPALDPNMNFPRI